MPERKCNTFRSFQWMRVSAHRLVAVASPGACSDSHPPPLAACLVQPCQRGAAGWPAVLVLGCAAVGGEQLTAYRVVLNLSPSLVHCVPACLHIAVALAAERNSLALSLSGQLKTLSWRSSIENYYRASSSSQHCCCTG